MSLEDRISYLEDIHRNFQIVGGSNVTVEGSLRQGYAICSTCPQQEEPAVPQPAPPSPPPPATGACCIGTDCSITTEADCIASGGTYQGDNTTCVPNPCGECCPPAPTFVSGTVSFSYTGTNGLDGTRIISGSGTFSGPTPFSNFTGVVSISGTDCCDADCLDLSVVVPLVGAAPSCHSPTGWTITLSLVLSSFCGFQTSFTLTYLYADCASGGQGSFSADLDVSGGAGFGTGTCHMDYTLT